MKKLFVISSASCFEGEVALINALFDAGMQVFHFRKPVISAAAHSELLSGIDPEFHHKVVLHQFHERGFELGIHRFHFSERERHELSSREVALPADRVDCTTNGVYSTSVHALVEDDELLKDYDYAFFGPIYDSISKKDYRAMELGDFKLPAHHKKKLVAIGGIAPHNIERVFDMGFDKAAILGALWSKPAQTLDVFEQLKRKCE